jgi:hypothetical protein
MNTKNKDYAKNILISAGLRYLRENIFFFPADPEDFRRKSLLS